MPLVVNLQRKIDIGGLDFQTFAAALSETDEVGGNFSVAFISDRRMKKLNSLFRGKTTTTDVLSFPHETDAFEKMALSGEPPSSETSSLGDIVISVEQAARQAAENGLSLETEIRQLMLHGVLHLHGFDHETDGGEMNRRELELRDKLGI